MGRAISREARVRPGCSGDRMRMLDGSRKAWGRSRGGWFLPTLPLTACDLLRRIVFLIFRTKRLITFGPKCTWSSGIGKPLLYLLNTGFKKPN